MRDKVPTAWADIAEITKTHGVRGEVVVVPTVGLPFLVRSGMMLVPVPPALNGPRWREVGRVRRLSAGWGVELKGVGDIGTARELVGRHLLASRIDLGIDLSQPRFAGTRHRLVFDVARGPLGCIETIMEGPANDVWVVRGGFGEVLVPVVPEFIVDSPSDESLPVLVHLPDGLVPAGPATGEEPVANEGPAAKPAGVKDQAGGHRCSGRGERA